MCEGWLTDAPSPKCCDTWIIKPIITEAVSADWWTKAHIQVWANGSDFERLGFNSLGEILEVLFYNPSLIYGHKHSTPSPYLPLYSKCHAPFSPSVSSAKIFHACPSLFSWATNLIITHVHQEINQLSRTNVPGGKNHLQASMNSCCPDWFKLVPWQALGKLSISALCKKYKACAPVS